VKTAVLELLKSHRGDFVSGEQIARDLNISRTAVWKHISALREEGYRIESRSRRGYRLQGVTDLLVPGEVLTGLATRFCGRPYYYYPSLVSTNNTAKELARKGVPEGTTVLAEEQSGGRGRLGRNWYSPRGGLWFSVVLRPPLHPARGSEATFVAAVAGAEALHNYLKTAEIGIKWPNDFLWQGKKLGGILTELTGEMDRISYLIIGIGLNVNLDPHKFPPEINARVTSLRQIVGRDVDRAELLRRLLAALEGWYLVWREDGFAPVRAAWKRYNACLDRTLRVSTPEGELVGQAVDVDLDGALLLETGGRIRRIVTGELFLEGDVG